MVLLHPDLEIDVETPISKIEGLVKAAGGQVTRRDNWGKKRLAYRRLDQVGEQSAHSQRFRLDLRVHVLNRNIGDRNDLS